MQDMEILPIDIAMWHQYTVWFNDRGLLEAKQKTSTMVTHQINDVKQIIYQPTKNGQKPTPKNTLREHAFKYPMYGDAKLAIKSNTAIKATNM